MFYLIASGATAWQEAGRLQGLADMPLSAGGLASAEAAAAAWQAGAMRARPKAVYCAGDEASRATAAAFAARSGCKVKELEELREVDVGLWQGLTEAELEERYPTAFGQWVENPTRVAIPGGEPLAEAVERLAGVVGKLLGRGGERTVVMVLQPVMLRLAMAMLGGTLPLRISDAQHGGSKQPAVAQGMGGAAVGKPLVREIELNDEAVRGFRAAWKSDGLLRVVEQGLTIDGDGHEPATPPGGQTPTSYRGGRGPRRVPA